PWPRRHADPALRLRVYRGRGAELAVHRGRVIAWHAGAGAHRAPAHRSEQAGTGTSLLKVPELDHLRDRLAAARLYLCTDARERQGDLPRFLDTVLANGVDIVQLRQKGLEAGQELRYLEVFRRACAAHDALLAVNDRADVAYACGADVLHLGQDDLPAGVARAILGPGPLIGLS